MLGIGKEAGIFIHAGLSGLIVVMFYHCIQIIRRLIPHNWLAISIEDFLFWIGMSIYLFVQIYYTSDGSIRWFFVLGVVFGVISSLVLSSNIKKLHKKIYDKKAKGEKKSVDKLKKTI